MQALNELLKLVQVQIEPIFDAVPSKRVFHVSIRAIDSIKLSASMPIRPTTKQNDSVPKAGKRSYESQGGFVRYRTKARNSPLFGAVLYLCHQALILVFGDLIGIARQLQKLFPIAYRDPPTTGSD